MLTLKQKDPGSQNQVPEETSLHLLLGAQDKFWVRRNISLISSHLSLNREGRWGTTDDFATSFLHFSLFSTALWDLANPPLPLSAFSSSPFHCALQDGFGQT